DPPGLGYDPFSHLPKSAWLRSLAPGGGKENRVSSRLFETDPEVARAIESEVARQAGNINLIASENLVSEAVLEAMGSVFTNKYAEGYPGKRYYGGCQHTDT